MSGLLWWSLALASDPSLATGQCEGEGTGADSWFSGDLILDSGPVAGIERWQLFPNKAWSARGAKACTLTWSVIGKVTTPGRCSDCDLSVSFRAEPLESSSGCSDELVSGRQTRTGQRVGSEFGAFDGHYDLERGADGSLTVYFAKSGKLLGTGKIEGDKLSWRSNHQCKWF